MIKPDWSKPKLKDGKPNPKFIKEIDGKDTYDGCDFTPEYLKEMNDKGYNIFFFPNHPSTNVYANGTTFLAGKDIDVFNFVYVDMDLKDKVYETKEQFLEVLSRFTLKPTMVVDSGHGLHAYWSIKDLTRDEFVYANLALIKYFNTDDSVFTVLQLMRLPGYRNTKVQSEIIEATMLANHSSGETYALDQFPNEIFQLDPREMARGKKHLDRLDGKLIINTADFIDNIDDLPESFMEFISDPANVSAKNLWLNPSGPPHNDRSKSDFSLINILYKNDFNRKEAFKIISNSQKALSHANRSNYAETSVDKIYSEKLSTKFKTVAQHNRSEDGRNLGDLVKGSADFDTSVLGNPWRKRELLGLIAGTGVGKTTVTLKWFKDAIENNGDNDDVYVFFSLEMTAGEIVDRWNNLVGPNSPLAERLYVIGAENEKFEPRNIGLQEILEDCTELKKMTGKNLGMVAIDHVSIISKHIDTRKKFTFGIDSEQGSGYGSIRTLSLNSICNQLKVLCKMIDTHFIILTQTTKAKGVGDLPIGKDGAYGISTYENIMDRIITIWQPLKLVQEMTPIRFLAWQYVKIRNKSLNDKIQDGQPKLMTYDLATSDFRNSTPEEYQEFERLRPITIERRDAVLKQKGGINYSINLSPEVLNKIKASLSITTQGN